MGSRLMNRYGEKVTVVRFSANKDEETTVASDIMCLLSPVDDGKYESWKARLKEANREILKGDILRRVDGTELQVLRTVTRKGIEGIEATRLDLKDYDRAERPLPENRMNASEVDFLPKAQLHSMIPQNVWSSFSQGAYGSAVFEAFKQVEIAVRKEGNYEATDYGTDLMRKAFHIDNGNLTDQNQPRAEKQACSDLFAGAIGYCKNPASHREVEITAEEAVELITLASYLLRIVDSRSQSEED